MSILAGISSGLVLGVGAFLGIVFVAGSGVLFVRSKLRKFSRSIFGTDSIIEGFKRQEALQASTPKSVSSMTRIVEPQIVRDFPDFVWEEFKHRAENMLTSALLAVSGCDVSLLVEASDEVKDQVRNQIAANEMAGVREVYDKIRIHQTEIAKYSKGSGSCVITIQSAVEYYHYKTSEGQLVEGRKDRKEQVKYNVELMYIQDAELVEYENSVGMNCPNCGAPIRSLGQVCCEYCGTAVTPVNIKVWTMHKYYKV